MFVSENKIYFIHKIIYPVEFIFLIADMNHFSFSNKNSFLDLAFY